MKIPFGIRLWILIAALLLVAGGMVYELFSALRRDQHLEARLTRSQIERFQFASEIRRGIAEPERSVAQLLAWSGIPASGRNLIRPAANSNIGLMNMIRAGTRFAAEHETEREVFKELDGCLRRTTSAPPRRCIPMRCRPW